VHRPLDLVDCHGRSESLAVLAGRPVAAFCGIGNPEAFRHSLLALGCRLVAFRAFADHHAYREGDLDALAAGARRLPGDGLVLTTQKDLVKLSRSELAGRALWALRIQLQVTAGRHLLERKLDQVSTGLARGPDERGT
jgi:tetraacyldisaccharide 4'-kinase